VQENSKADSQFLLDSQELRKEAGGRIRQVRKEKGWTQVELAKRCSLSQPHIGNLETGRDALPDKTASSIAGVLGVRVLWLLDGEEPRGLGLPHEILYDLLTSDRITYGEKSVLNQIFEAAWKANWATAMDGIYDDLAPLVDGLQCLDATGKSIVEATMRAAFEAQYSTKRKKANWEEWKEKLPSRHPRPLWWAMIKHLYEDAHYPTEGSVPRSNKKK